MAGEDNNLENGAVDKTDIDSKTPGERLRAERERRGLSLIQVAGEMHMDVRVAQALEEDDYSPLGAPIFVKGHLRNYAKLLGLSADELINDYAQASAPQTPELMTNRPTVGSMDQAGGNGTGWFAGIGIFLIIILLACLGWWF
ncbi:MAG TPA: helix-turn-helix transcriptional regulator, partial [Gammaproteobacteria bacterium]|nr:helix-turn-helix transcriptional regulator [Gammaproteobacteria bacterium]